MIIRRVPRAVRRPEPFAYIPIGGAIAGFIVLVFGTLFCCGCRCCPMYASCSRVGTAICPCCCSLPVLAKAARVKQLAEAEEASKKAEEASKEALSGGAVIEMTDIRVATSSAPLPPTIQQLPQQQQQQQQQSLPPMVPVPKKAVPLKRSPSWSSVVHSQAAGAIPLVQRLSGAVAPHTATQVQFSAPAGHLNESVDISAFNKNQQSFAFAHSQQSNKIGVEHQQNFTVFTVFFTEMRKIVFSTRIMYCLPLPSSQMPGAMDGDASPRVSPRGPKLSQPLPPAPSYELRRAPLKY